MKERDSIPRELPFKVYQRAKEEAARKKISPFTILKEFIHYRLVPGLCTCIKCQHIYTYGPSHNLHGCEILGHSNDPQARVEIYNTCDYFNRSCLPVTK